MWRPAAKADLSDARRGDPGYGAHLDRDNDGVGASRTGEGSRDLWWNDS
ncbi:MULTISPECIES: excalibur calcium-binding domain-containing protein [unclassified Luteimonas]